MRMRGLPILGGSGDEPSSDMSADRWKGMRLVLEWLGLVEPDRSRKEPVAVPSWAPVAVAASVAFLAGLVALGTWIVLRLLFL